MFVSMQLKIYFSMREGTKMNHGIVGKKRETNKMRGCFIHFLHPLQGDRSLAVCRPSSRYWTPKQKEIQARRVSDAPSVTYHNLKNRRMQALACMCACEKADL